MIQTSTAARDPGRWFVLASIALAVVAALIFAFAPAVSVVEESSQAVGGSTSGGTAAGVPQPTGTRVAATLTVPEAQGWESVAFVAGPPLAMAALPLLARGRGRAIVLRTLAAVLLLGWVLLGAVSFGILYMPSAGLMLVAAVLAYGRS